MKHSKTTILGIVTIAISLLGVIKIALVSGVATIDWTIIIPSVTAGWALIHAADATSDKQ